MWENRRLAAVSRTPCRWIERKLQKIEECSTKTALDLGQVCDKGSDVWN
jgi:hypothetical protein